MRFRSACLSLASLTLALGCTAKRPPAEEAKPEFIPAGELVVLTRTASVYFAREDKRGMSLAVSRGESAPGHTFEVLTVTDDRIHVRTLAPDRPPSCAGNFDFVADDYELHFWVERADLRRVLTAPETFAFADGTKLELRAGVPVIDAARGELAIGGQSLFVTLEHAELGLSFPPPEALEFAEADRPLRADALLHYGETSPPLRVEAPFQSASDVLELSSRPEGRAEKLLVFDNACGRFTLRSSGLAAKGLYAMRGPKDAIPRMARNFDPDLAARNAAILGVMKDDDHFVDSPYGGAFDVPEPDECTPLRWTIASGVALSWADGGHPAGIVRRAHELPENAREIENRVCFEIEHVGLGLCADANKLARTGDPECPAPD